MSIDKTLKIRLKDYHVEEIAPKVYKINEFNLSTMFVIVGEKSAMVIDCGTGVGDFKAVVERLTEGKPYSLYITHAHVDHVGGREQFEEMHMSEKDVPIIKDVTVSYRKSYIDVMRYLMGFKVIRKRDAVIKKVEKEPKLVFVKEGDVIDLGGKIIKVFEVPGHTLGSLAFLDETDRIIFTGDDINPNTLLFLKHSTTVEELYETLLKIKNIEGYDTIWASHLSAPVSKEVFENGIKCAEKISKRRTGFPMIAMTGYNKYVIIHLSHRRRKKKIK